MYIESLEDAAERRPYKENREWTESSVMKPIRSSTFRERVLKAYQYRCAICGIDNPSILIAAHIRPVSELGTDKTSNGISLCRNDDYLYESGQLIIHEDGSIEYKNKNMERLEKINLPENKGDRPSNENLAYRKNVLKNKCCIKNKNIWFA